MRVFISRRLRANTEEAMKEALQFGVREGEWVPYGKDWAIDLIGPMVSVEAVLGDEGVVVVPAVWDMRFHVNLKAAQDVIDAIDPLFITSPANPKRVWFGE